MLPAVVPLELVVDGRRCPVRVPQQMKQLVKGRALRQYAFTLLDVWNLLAESGQLELPVDVLELESLRVFTHVFQSEPVVEALLHRSLGRVRTHVRHVLDAFDSLLQARLEREVVEVLLRIFRVLLWMQ